MTFRLELSGSAATHTQKIKSWTCYSPLANPYALPGVTSTSQRNSIPALTKCHVRLKEKKPPDRVSTSRPYPFYPVTLGDCLRKMRLDLGLVRFDIAEQLDVTADSIRNWENNWNGPSLAVTPKIIDFVGYCPYDSTLPLSTRVALWRTYNKIAQKTIAKLANLDPGTLSRIERGKLRSKKKEKSYVSQVKCAIQTLLAS
jgi:transcriptional regulator with XRE-family HTH domain